MPSCGLKTKQRSKGESTKKRTRTTQSLFPSRDCVVLVPATNTWRAFFISMVYAKMGEMKEKLLKELRGIFESFEEVKLVYLFGSRARGDVGEMSDYDFGIYLEGDQKLRLELESKISEVLDADRVDLLILNRCEKPELKYNVIKEGELLFEREPYKVQFEPQVLNEYFDFRIMLRQYGLTKA